MDSRRRSHCGWRGAALAALFVVGSVGSAAAQGAGPDSVTLRWTAPGDDGNVGTAARYDLRMSGSSITESNFAAATPVTGVPAPRVAGSAQSMVVRGLTRGVTVYFAIKAVDEAGNVAPISNVLRVDWNLDTAPPAAPTGIAAAVEGEAVRVHWNANGEPDLAAYTVWRATNSGGPWTAIASTAAGVTEHLDTAMPAGAAALYYRVSALDQSGNESARSAAVSVSLAGGGPAPPDWALLPAYPNPSPLADPVTIPVVLSPASGNAEIQIADSGGRIVRRLPLAGMAAGPANLVWDGRNEAGLVTAPGVYTVWLAGAGARRSVKIARVP